jgi:ABC-type bacteriocin/lantibiotic exporter with double-glycine peptidase domain
MGHKQLINIARTILHKPKILLFDYVASSMSFNYRPYINELMLKEFKSSTFFLATHDPALLPQFRQRIDLTKRDN